MQKIKTINSVIKRFKKLASNKIKSKQSNKQHILTKKKKKKKRKLKKTKLISKKNLNNIKKCMY